MSMTMAGILGIAILFTLFFLKVPISFSMFIVGFIGIVVVATPESAFSLLSGNIWGEFSKYSLSVIPLYILMGEIIYRSGIAKSLFDTAYKWVGHLRGGMAWTTILASAGFASICGSNAASSATMGTMALPELKKYKYNNKLSAGAVAAGGTLGIIIPPSTVLIIIALQSEQSVSELFKASLIPGLLLTLIFIVLIGTITRMKPAYGPAADIQVTMKDKVKSLLGIIPIFLLFIFVIGGLFMGIFTPTESGAFGAFGAIVLSLVMRRLTWDSFKMAVISSLKSASMVVMLIVGAIYFGRFLTITRIPFEIAQWTQSLSIPPILILALIILIFIAGGALMDAIGFLVLAIPIFSPTVYALGYDPIWFSVVLCVVTSLGAITPPVGINAYVVHGIDKSIPVKDIFKGLTLFILGYLIVIVLLLVFPEIVTFVL
ncbi:TRAP transporter large permease [Evansella clarkii]|uniref:TRAP transporter large permease n=1 Tax=Evansella clarkii TaxID=79879 RepID=UPI00099732FB|nr:TRAP transporter large permease [Evansella clarkii]